MTLRPGEGTTLSGEWGDWLAPADAWARVISAWKPAICEPRDLPLSDAGQRILATDIVAPFDAPLFDRSTMDGYAVRAADTATASTSAPVWLAFAGEIAIGTPSTAVVEPGQAMWVATGSMIPAGADGVVMVERTHRTGDIVLVQQAIAPGENVANRGDDVHSGEIVLRAGHLLRPQDIAVLASMGIAQVAVRERPRVAVISGGDELLSPGEQLTVGKIYDANSYSLAAQIESWGGEPQIFPRLPDEAEEVQKALGKATNEARIVLLSGGSSVGIKDLTAGAIDQAGKPGVIVHGIAMRPGRPTLLGVVNGALIIGIPGNPVSAMISCEVFARPALETLLARQPSRVAGAVGDYALSGRLMAPVRSLLGRQDYVRVRLERDGVTVTVHPVPGGSGSIRSMVDAEGLLVVPPERAELNEGETVDVRLF